MWWMTFSEPKKMKEKKVFFSAQKISGKNQYELNQYQYLVLLVGNQVK